MFRVGQKVVCVYAGPADPMRPGQASDYLKKGAIYTIREVCEFPYAPDRKSGVGIRLVGVYREDDSHNPEWSDYPFGSFRFRPIVERKTDISVFHEILRKASKRVSA